MLAQARLAAGKLKTEPRPQVQPRATAVETVGDVEVDLDERRDDEEARAGALLPRRVLQARAEVDRLSRVHEHRHAKLGAVQHRGDRNPQLTGRDDHTIAGEGAG